MGAYSGPELVDDGLVLALDAANTRSYGGSGTTWTDVSYRGNNGTLTNGPVFTQEPSLEPFGGAGAVSFDGTGDSLTTGPSANLALGSGDFTVEAFIFPTGNGDIDIFASSRAVSGISLIYWTFEVNTSTGQVSFQSRDAGGTQHYARSATSVITTNTWHHVAAVRQSNVITVYVNGVAGPTTVNDGGNNLTEQYVAIGLFNFPGFVYYFSGYISNLRIVKGTALYTSNFTPKRQPLLPESAPNTVLLTCQKGNIRDRSPSAHTITINGDAKSISGASYFEFDGTNDYVSITDNINLRFGTDTFTITAWIYPHTVTPATNNPIVAKGTPSGVTTWQFDISSTRKLRLQYDASSSISSSSNLTAKVWTHVAVVREGTGTNETKLYINGVLDNTGTVSSNLTTTGVIRVGHNRDGTIYYDGYISNTRVYKGKGLTAEEVLQNYQNTKSRYGL